jgi:hypothetical protein
MFDLILGPPQAVEGGNQDEEEIMGSRPILGSFLGFGMVINPWKCVGVEL